jgi:hypothetical protein
MGLYLNQLPPTEVARLKAELAETLIANFCYPRFYDYRINALRMRPVDRAKRQEVWQYLNAVDFNVWGRVDVDSPDFQRQVERLFIHFVQRNRNFFGPQGRKRMIDVRSLITSTSNALAEGVRGYLRGKPGYPPFGSPRPVSSWMTTNATGRAEPSWEQILSSTMLLQQQIQESRNEVRPGSAPPASSPPQPTQTPPSSSRPGSAPVPSRRPPRPTTTRPATNGSTNNGHSIHEDEVMSWPSQERQPVWPSDEAVSTPFPTVSKEPEPLYPAFPPVSPPAEAGQTLPLPLSKQENPAFQPPVSPEIAPDQPTPRPKRGSDKAAEAPLVSPTPSTPIAEPAVKPSSQQRHSPDVPPSQALQTTSPTPVAEVRAKPTETATILISDEDVMIFERLRHQLVIWLRVEAVRASIELNGQGALQLIDALRHQDGIDQSRLQIVSTLLNMCDQIIANGRATLFDYKQAMMFYLMHTLRTH